MEPLNNNEIRPEENSQPQRPTEPQPSQYAPAAGFGGEPEREKEPSNRHFYGPLVGIIIIVIVLAIGGLYYWGKVLTDRDTAAEEASQNTQTQ